MSFLPLVPLLAVFGFYLIGVSPAIDGGDSGEFIASSFTLGIPHAPGYPLFQLIGKVVYSILPFSSIAYRAHVLSALIVVATLVLFFKLLEKVLGSGNRWFIFLATLFLATRPLITQQARVCEVFGLNALFACAVLLCVARGDILLAWFLFGLGLGNHHTLLVLFPVLLIPTLLSPMTRHGEGSPNSQEPAPTLIRRFGGGLSFFVLGLTVYLYLPIRAHASPPVNFGNPETWQSFLAVVTRKEFGSLSLHPAALPFRDLSLTLAQTKVFALRVYEQLHLGGLILVTIGFFVGIRRPGTRLWTLLALCWFLGLGLGFEIFSNLSPTSDIGQWRLERFLVLPLLAASALVAFAFTTAPTGGAAYRNIVFLGCWLAAVATPSPINNFRRNLVFRDFAVSVLRSAPKDSRIVIDRVLFDEPTSALLVTTVVEKKRPDVHFYYRPGTLFEPVYGKDVLRLTWGQRFERQRAVEQRELTNGDKPVRYLGFEKANAPFENPKMDGLLYAPHENPGLGIFLLQREGATDYPSRLIAAHTPYFFGKAALERNNVVSANQWFNAALARGGRMAWLASNLGGIYVQNNLFDDAARLFDRAVSWDPYFANAQYGKGFMAYQRNDVPTMRVAWRKYLALEPHGKMADGVRQQLDRDNRSRTDPLNLNRRNGRK